MWIINQFLDYYAWIATAASVVVGLTACWLFDLPARPAGFYVRQVIFNGVAHGFGWLALAVLWRRHCWGSGCGFANIDVFDFGLLLIAFLGLTCLLPYYATKGLHAALESLRKTKAG